MDQCIGWASDTFAASIQDMRIDIVVVTFLCPRNFEPSECRTRLQAGATRTNARSV
jgi:hypothetical protein